MMAMTFSGRDESVILVDCVSGNNQGLRSPQGRHNGMDVGLASSRM